MLEFFRKLPVAAQPPGGFEIPYAGAVYKIKLKRSASARRYTLRISSARHDIILTMPACGSLKEARSFTERNMAWIAARVERLPKGIEFLPGAIFPLRGILHLIVHCPDQRGGIIKSEEGGPEQPRNLNVNGALPHVPRRIRDYLLREARRDFETAVEHHCAHLGIPARKITLRDTTSRWGSCSASGSLNFSWRLIMAPSFVLDYLAAHEVAHLKHLNHSAQFWTVLATLSPDVERAEKWLKMHGSELLRYGPKRG
jgi:predicted metal-dependent hydrolase